MTAGVHIVREPAELRSFDIAPGFFAITRSAELRALFTDILGLGAAITVAVDRSMLIGYAADLPFVPVQWEHGEVQRRWSLVPQARELGALEVARPFRGQGLARLLLEEMFSGGRLEDRIVIAEGLHWHWDLEQSGLSVAEARQRLLALFGGEGFQRYDTDEPEVSYSPGNFLLARLGAQVAEESVRAFREALFSRGAK